jgi:hypothetical protein
VADFEVLAGAVVVGVTVSGVVVTVVADSAPESEALVVDALCDEPADDPVPDVVGAEVAVVAADVVVPGISFETISPSTPAAPAARTATDLDVRRTRVRASSRRLVPSPGVGCGGRVGRPRIGSSFDEGVMPGMSPGEARHPRTVR